MMKKVGDNIIMKKGLVLFIVTLLFLEVILISCSNPTDDLPVDKPMMGDHQTNTESDEELSMQTDTDNESVVGEETAPVQDETLSPLVFDDAALNEVVDQLRTQGYDMEQLTFRHADDYSMTYKYEMTLSDRVFHPGETIEIKVSEIYHYGTDWSGDWLQKMMEITVVNVAMEAMSLSDSPKEYRFHMKDSDTICFEIPEDIEQGAYMIYVDINDTFSYLAPIIIY